MRLRVDDIDRAADLGGDVGARIVVREDRGAWPRADEEVRRDFLRAQIDHGDSAGRFGRDVRPVHVVADRDSFGLGAGDERRDPAGCDVDDRGGAGIFVRDDEARAIARHGDAFRIEAACQAFDDGVILDGHDTIAIARRLVAEVAHGDVKAPARRRDPARTRADTERVHDGIRLRVDDAHRSGTLVRDVQQERSGGENHLSVKRNAVRSRASVGVTPRFGMVLFGSIACGFCSHLVMTSGVFGYLPASVCCCAT